MAAEGEVEGARKERERKSAGLITRPVRRTHATRPSSSTAATSSSSSSSSTSSSSSSFASSSALSLAPGSSFCRGESRDARKNRERTDRRTDGWTGDERLRDFVGTGVKANWSINYPGEYGSRFALPAGARERRRRTEIAS